jgi:hypothetical protein
MEFYAAINASSLIPSLSATVALDMAARVLTAGILFDPFVEAILYVFQFWNGYVPSNNISLVEFDNDHHQIFLDLDNCVFRVHVNHTTVFNTLPVISDVVGALAVEPYVQQLSGCDDEGLFSFLLSHYQHPDCVGKQESTTSVRENSDCPQNNEEISGGTLLVSTASNPLIYDTVLFNDEVDMLLTRFTFLSNLVDFHIVVESSTTFTGTISTYYDTRNSSVLS